MGNPYIEEYNKSHSIEPVHADSNTENETHATLSDEMKAFIKIDLLAILMKYDNVEPLSGVITEIRKYLQAEG